MTEKQTEDYLQSEVRMLTMPNGKVKPVRGFALMWSVFDLLQDAGMFSQQRLIQIASTIAGEENVPFEQALERVCSYAQTQVQRW